jgi:hypothetical protein
MAHAQKGEQGVQSASVCGRNVSDTPTLAWVREPRVLCARSSELRLVGSHVTKAKPSVR